MKRDDKDPESLSVDEGGDLPSAETGFDGRGVSAGATQDFPIVGVGASAGGLEAFTQLLQHLPADSGMALVLVQHLDPTHKSLLREALAKTTAMTVIQPQNGTEVRPNHIYVIPSDADMTIAGSRLMLIPRRLDERRPHLPIDFFFRSLAATRGSQAMGVVLSGNASDGTEGLRAIKLASGLTFAQDPRSAKFGDMPRSAVDAGVVDRALAIPELARELVRLGYHPYVTARAAAPGPLPSGAVAAVAKILLILREQVGVDFAEYKGQTFDRRLARRMALRRADGPEDYLALLERDSGEVRALYEDILIHVTSFFRDPEVFEALESEILPAIVKQKSSGAPIRMWVAGCSTGEEVYSLGISLLEVLGDSSTPVQIFGSDLSAGTIAKARAGIYSDAALREISEERRKRYFVKTDRGYRINEMVRDLCLFVQHDLARDAPFAKLDLVSCRNVLIYFDKALQTRILPTFHHALNQPGYLLLGRTESISGFGRWFSAVDKSNKIFARTAVPSALRISPLLAVRPPEPPAAEIATQVSTRRPLDLGRHLDRVLLARYAPPGVLINENMEVLQFRGQTGAFLQPAPGAPQNDIIKMARPGLVSPLRATIAQAQKLMAPVTRSGVEVDQDGFTRTCNLVVFPFSGLPDVKAPLYVVLFEEAVSGQVEGGESTVARRRRSDWLDEGRRIPRVEHELNATKEYLQSVIEEHGRTNEDLGSANEELVSGNEELQSMNEELETAKEELQSTNEELTTVNDELHSRNQEVTQANGDLLNLLDHSGYPYRHSRPGAADPSLHAQGQEHLERRAVRYRTPDRRHQAQHRRPRSRSTDRRGHRDHGGEGVRGPGPSGHWYRMQIRPYKGLDNKIDGAILSLVDIDALKQLVGSAQLARAEAERANGAKDLFLAVLGHELRTPLTTLLLRAQMLRRGAISDSVKLAQVGETIERATRIQMQLVDDLLDVSKIVAGKLKVKLRAVDLSAVVHAALDEVTPAAQAKSLGIDVRLDESIGAVAGDCIRLQQVVVNLLTNAIKFTPVAGQIVVTLEAAGRSARIRVSDSGAGIEPTFLPQVFNRFSQQDTSSTRTHGGLGLGLAIVRHLVEQHGGEVEAQSPGVGQGATFSVSIPLMKARQALTHDAEILVSAGRKDLQSSSDHDRLKALTVLVIDDDLATRESVAEMLEGMGAEVRRAGSAAEAMIAVRELRPKVLLCDIAMPGEDGYTFIRNLRALGRDVGGETPALALTALAAEGDPQRFIGRRLSDAPDEAGRHHPSLRGGHLAGRHSSEGGGNPCEWLGSFRLTSAGRLTRRQVRSLAADGLVRA